MGVETQQFESFESFYPFYLGEHSNRRCRQLHFVGTALALVSLFLAVLTANLWWLLAVPLVGYGFAWAGHVLFEHNRPATFSHPWYSLRGDLRMFRQMLSGRIKF